MKAEQPFFYLGTGKDNEKAKMVSVKNGSAVGECNELVMANGLNTNHKGGGEERRKLRLRLRLSSESDS
ncbi:hypothetical protein V6N13_132256 [Hibiscus sabdariffa]